MYEDNRTIDQSGMLGPRVKSTYQPKPIKLQFNAASAPDPSHVNVNQANAQSLSLQQAQLAQQQAANNKKSGKIICARCYDLGLMDKETFTLDQAYGEWLMNDNPQFMQWYWSWAKYVVDWMDGETWHSQLFIAVIWQLVKPWSTEMAFRLGARPKGHWLGKAMMGLADVIYHLTKTEAKHA